jgi:hypothetical protein
MKCICGKDLKFNMIEDDHEVSHDMLRLTVYCECEHCEVVSVIEYRQPIIINRISMD